MQFVLATTHSMLNIGEAMIRVTQRCVSSSEVDAYKLSGDVRVLVKINYVFVES